MNGLYKIGNICPAAGPFPISKRRKEWKKKEEAFVFDIYHGVVVVVQ